MCIKKSNYTPLYNNPDCINATVYFFTDSTLYKKIASNTIAQIISKILTAGISIFLIGILTKYLPIELYGSYNKVYSYLWIFAFLADLGLYTLAIREISRGIVPKEKIIWNILTLRVAMALWVWIISFLIALILPWYNDSITLIAIAIVWAFTLVSLLNSSLLALMQSQMKMEFSLVSVVAGKIINISLIALALIYVFNGIGMENSAFISVFVAWFIWICLNTYMNYLYAKKICIIKFLYDWNYIKNIFKLSLPYGIALFLSVVYFKIDVILISLLESPEKADISIALYGLPMKIVEVLMVLGWFYLNSVLPSLSEKFRAGKSAEIADILWTSLKVLISFSLCIFIFWSSLARDIISVIATPEYINPISHSFNSPFALSLALWVLVFHFVSLAFIYVLIASERQWLLLRINIWITLINIIWNIILIPYYSFIWAAVITLISQGILMCVSAYIVLKDISIPKKYYISIVKTLLLWAFMLLVFRFVLLRTNAWSIWNVFVFGTLFALIYAWIEYKMSRKLFFK